MALVLPECKSAPLYEEINSLILEYLELNGLDKTIAAFSSECRGRGIPGPFNSSDETKAAFSFYEGEKLLKSFDEGDLDAFVKLWKSFQGHVQVTTDDMKKLEVYLRVHFSLWPSAHGEPDAVQTQAMNHLKVFFEEQSCQLSHDAAILPLFALPYVSDPKNHPIFRDLFQPNWSNRLRAQLEATLLKYFDLLQQNLGIHSKLAAIVLKSHSSDLNFRDKSNNNNNSLSTVYHRDRFFQLVSTYRQARKLLRNTRESYGKLLKISNELITGLEASVAGQKVSLEPIMKGCYEIFPELFAPIDQSGVLGQPDKEYFKRLANSAQFDNIIDSDVSLFFVGISDMSPDCLDYKRIKSVLRSDDSNNGDKLCLLQALRWLLTKSTPKCRQTAMNAFVEADLLGLDEAADVYRTKLFDCMMSKNPTYLKECFARILNTFSSMKSGRAYMGSNTHCVDLLVKSLHTFSGLNESYICQMVIATLQKLSLRKQMRLEMIEREVIQWLVVYLKVEFVRSENGGVIHTGNNDKTAIAIPSNGASGRYYNPYLMEYAWALLMNLCLHEESRQASSAIATDIVSCVTQMLLSKPTRDVYPYVISTLYSLLRNPDVFAAAKKMGVQTLFANCTNIEDTEMAHHFSHVTAILQTSGFDRVNTTTGEVDYDDDDDIDPSDFEPEIEVTEAWEESLGENNLTGDDLLMQRYLIQKESTVQPCVPSPPQQTHSSKISRPTGVFVRPTTPSSNVVPKYDYLKDEAVNRERRGERSELKRSNSRSPTNIRSSRVDNRTGKHDVNNNESESYLDGERRPSVRSPSLSPRTRQEEPMSKTHDADAYRHIDNPGVAVDRDHNHSHSHTHNVKQAHHHHQNIGIILDPTVNVGAKHYSQPQQPGHGHGQSNSSSPHKQRQQISNSGTNSPHHKIIAGAGNQHSNMAHPGIHDRSHSDSQSNRANVNHLHQQQYNNSNMTSMNNNPPVHKLLAAPNPKIDVNGNITTTTTTGKPPKFNGASGKKKVPRLLEKKGGGGGGGGQNGGKSSANDFHNNSSNHNYHHNQHHHHPHHQQSEQYSIPDNR